MQYLIIILIVRILQFIILIYNNCQSNEIDLFPSQFFSNNTNNIVNSSDNLMLLKICNVAFRSENYNKKMNHHCRLNKKPKSNELQVIFRGPISYFEFSVTIMAYTCEYSVAKDTTFMSKYYVAAGSGDHSLILLKKIENDNNDSPHYEIIELVKYVTEDYINFYFQGFY